MKTTLIAASMLLSTAALAQNAKPAPLSPAASNPVTLQLMQGFPPSAEHQVSWQNALVFPKSRWSLYHLRSVLPSFNVRAAAAPAIAPLAEAPRDVRGIAFKAPDGSRTTVGDWLDANYTDSFLVLHDGKIVYEYYREGAEPHQPHMLMSDTKSVTGLLAADLIAQGKLDPAAPVSQYVPELKDSGWGDATVQQTLDMTTAIDYSEVYTDPKANFMQYVIASGIVPPPPNYPGAASLYTYLPTVGKKGEHGAGFVYRTVNTEVMGWIIQRVTNKPLGTLLSERIWQPMGAEDDAYYIVDRQGMPVAGGGLNATLRDMARFGEMVRNRGQYNGKQILEPAAFDRIYAQNYPVKLPLEEYSGGRKGYSYHDYWWISNNADGVIECWGINGQFVHVNPATKTVIVKHSSRPVASNNPFTAMATAAFAAIDHTVNN